MLLPRFDYHSPSTLAEACQILGKYRDGARLLAGGTDLLVNMKHKLLSPAHVVSLDRVPELGEIAKTKAGVSIGPLVTASELAQSRSLKNGLSALASGAGKLGSPLIRNRATIGGNLVTARPASDMGPPLLALGARVVLSSEDGQREVSLDDFFLGPGQTVIADNEVLSGAFIPRPEPGTGSSYVKLTLRQTLEIAIVNVAAAITLGSKGNKIKSARVVLSAVAPTPIRSPKAEKVLVGATAGEKTFAQAAEAAVKDAKPITDYRGSAEYRKLMVEVLTRRALHQALGNAR